VADDPIATPAIRAQFDGRPAEEGAKASTRRLKSTFEESNSAIEAQQRRFGQRIQGIISQINAEKPRREMFELGRAIQTMGGVAKLSEGQVERLRVQVERLAAAGAKVPTSLQSVLKTPPAGGGLGAAARQQLSGQLAASAPGGLGSIMGTLGPGGLAAAAGIGAVAVAAGAAYTKIASLAAEAERWTNVAKSTGLSVEVVQQLEQTLEDAGVSGVDLKSVMKELSAEVATGGKQLERFGISIKGWDLMSQEERLRAFAGIVAGIQDPATQSAVAVAGFGRAGKELIPVLADIASGAYSANAALGGAQVQTLTEVDAKLDEYGRKWKNFWKEATYEAIKFAEVAAKGGPKTITPEQARRLGDRRLKDLTPEEAKNLGLQDFVPKRELVGPPQETPEEKAAREKEEARQKRQVQIEATEALKRRRSEQLPGLLKEFEQQNLSLAEIHAWEQKLLAAGATRLEVEEKINRKVRERIDYEQKEGAGIFSSDEMIRATFDDAKLGIHGSAAIIEENRNARFRVSEGYAKSVLGSVMPDPVDPSDRSALPGYNPLEVRGTRDTQADYARTIQLAQVLRNAGVSADELQRRLEATGMSAEDASGFISQWAPSFEVMAQRAYDAGLSTEEIKEQLAATGASPERIEKALDSINKKTLDWSARLQDAANTLRSMGGPLGAIGGAIGGLLAGGSGIGAGLKGLKEAKKVEGFEGFLGKAGSYGQIAASALALGGQIFSTVKGLFSSGKLKREAKEAGEILGKTVSKEQLQALKDEYAEAKKWGKTQAADFKSYLREQRYEEDKAKRTEAAQKKADDRSRREAGLTEAKAGVEEMLQALEKGDFSDSARAAASKMISSVRAALLQAGMGYAFDQRLQESEGYQAAQGLAGGAARTMRGMREANGMVSADMMAAGGTIAQETKDAAIQAALAAGLTQEEAQKAGFGAISTLLQEQLNASIASGRDLDANTKALIEEARQNGIDIIADPMVESVAVEKEMLAELKTLNGKSGAAGGAAGAGTGNNLPPADRSGQRVSAASGLAPVKATRDGVLQYHDGEWVEINGKGFMTRGGGFAPFKAGDQMTVLPKNLMRGGLISAAAGLYQDPDGPIGGEPRERPRMPAAGDSVSDSPSGGAQSVASVVQAQLAAIVPEIVSATQKARPVNVQYAPAVSISEDPTATKERREDLRTFTNESVMRMLRERNPEFMGELRRALAEGN
jgi:hypothetical protein